MKKAFLLISAVALTLLLTTHKYEPYKSPPIQKETVAKIVQPELAVQSFHVMNAKEAKVINDWFGYEIARPGDAVIDEAGILNSKKVTYSYGHEAILPQNPFKIQKPERGNNTFLVNRKYNLSEGFVSKVRPPLKQLRS